ncbi:isochorismatase family protein [Hymenobacter psoromatis]|uniref:isochorismatase family protein n=1 Tax=Hymenobacter psoromatis TaxID=1484116 RepID=UPI001CC09C81|nr:isochorismatase family protein [Hymenobacter psoromatis]
MVTALDKNTALVLIDLQRAIVQMPVVDPISGVLTNAGQLLAAFRRAGLPVVLVTVDPANRPDLRNDAQRPSRTVFPPEALALTPEIEPVPDDIRITKHSWGAFYDTGLEEALRQRGVTGIVLAGVSTSIGVESTARAANERGYNLTFAQDAMTDMVASAQENSLRVIFPRIGEVDTTANIIRVLEGGRG